MLRARVPALAAAPAGTRRCYGTVPLMCAISGPCTDSAAAALVLLHGQRRQRARARRAPSATPLSYRRGGAGRERGRLPYDLP